MNHSAAQPPFLPNSPFPRNIHLLFHLLFVLLRTTHPYHLYPVPSICKSSAVHLHNRCTKQAAKHLSRVSKPNHVLSMPV
ncbi:hypothetical protein BKA61DRAFT_597019 [Leptodontidium sp. MPI-SDFR-AT-0119]|nr:hypothetical protein BKA61DRAFT_597019 [Leptodontidium sp. MPI-SDFR-AT-0119]